MKQTEIKTETNGKNPLKGGTSITNNETLIAEFLEEIKKDTSATLVLSGNGNGSKNLIVNSLVIQTTDQSTSDLILDKIKNLPEETFEDVLLAIADQLKSRSSS